jgi:hypothetical protein
MTYSYQRFTPVYMTEAEFLSAVAVEPAQTLINPGKIFVQDAFLFVNEVGKGVHIFDNKNPASPHVLAFLRVPGNYDIAFECGNLYLDSGSDLLVFDMSRPESPQLIHRVRNAFPAILEYRGYVADPSKGIVTEWVRDVVSEPYSCDMDIPALWEQNQVSAEEASNPSLSAGRTINPAAAGKAGSMSRFIALNDHLYIVSPSEMNVFSLQNCQAPAKVSSFSVSFSGSVAEMVSTLNNYLLVGTNLGVQFWDASQPAAPSYLTEYQHVQACDPVVGQGDYAYVTLRNGDDQGCGPNFTNELLILDISNIHAPVAVGQVNLSNPHGLGIEGANLFVADGAAGLKWLDASNPRQMQVPHTQSAAHHGYDVIVNQGLLIMTGDDGISQYDYSAPGQLRLLSHLPVSGVR